MGEWQSLCLGVGIGLFASFQSTSLIDQCNEIHYNCNEIHFNYFFPISPLFSVAPLPMEFSRQE